MPISIAPRTGLRPNALMASAAFALTLFAAPAMAQGEGETPAPAPAVQEAEAAQTRSPDTILATVGGVEITEGDLLYAAEDLAQDLQQVPPADRRAFLLTVLIDMKVMANAARGEGLDESETFARRLDYLEDRALRRAFFSEVIEAGVTDERIEETYEELVAEFEPEPELRARHILVPTIEEAQEVLAELEGGMAFEEAATEYSIDTGSAAEGGDLGWFRTGMMVEPFEQAAFALEVGQMSEPVESQFGFHIIELQDRRVSSAPPLEQLQPQIAQQVLYENFDSIVSSLKEEANVEISDPELAAAVEAQGGL
ncbi:peptidylprolyl isomerase [Pelagibacterium montanilacus]|uniref:peptidylprolyl isomerase n=1 Tax=Pelagibacterium montanilacus TaxID=2185280 RepID=UPI000F8F6138|nr:peptidylprolyl isomerase [Pelagibacterium montanilacus]